MELYTIINTIDLTPHYIMSIPDIIVNIPSIVGNPTTIRDVISRQSFDGGWICPECKFHKGNLKCDKNMFISFAGCWTKDCSSFEKIEK